MSNPYLTELEKLLQAVPQEERKEILQDYQEHFRLAAAEGKSMDEIIRSLGGPEVLAEEILADYADVAAQAKSEPPGRSRAWRNGALGVLGAIIVAASLWGMWGYGDNGKKNVFSTDQSPSPAADAAPPISATAPIMKPGGRVEIRERQEAASPVRRIRVETTDTNIEVKTSKDAKPQILLEGTLTVLEGEAWTDYYEYVIDTAGDEWQVRIRLKEPKKMNMSQERSTTLVLFLPEEPLDSIMVSTVSGFVKAPVLQVAEFTASSTSGSIEVAGLVGENHNIANVSGKITVGSLSGDFDITTVSGNVELYGASWQSSSLVSTISGNIIVKAAEKLAYDYHLSTLSGVASCEYPDASNLAKSKKQCTGSTGEGDRTLELSSISGSLAVKPEG